MRERTPVTVVSGNLGAGKTTFVNHLLENADRRLAVLVNDMGDVNIDASLLENASSLSREGIAELSNGCICCELQDDLATEVRALAQRYDFDHLVVESSGISEPAPVAQLFTVGDASARYEVDALVTVVDARVLAETFAGEHPERETPPDAEDRPLSDLLVEQLEVSNVVLLNKTDLVPAADLERLEAMIAALQPDATVHRTAFAEIDPDAVIGVEAFDPDELGDLAGWQRALAEARAHELETHEHGHTHEDDHDHAHDQSDGHAHEHGDHSHDGCHLHHDHRTPETVYGVGSVTVRRQCPLDPDCFASFLRELPSSVIRLKGPCWIAGADDLVVQVSGAGPSIYAEAEGEWIATLPAAQRRLYRESNPDLPWDEEFGDRRTELVFIGTDLDRDELESDLEACFVDPAAVTDASNRFPAAPGERTVLRE
ncbi:CobW family GTP-binding protein [Natronobeatus ordinarius]|uniref:CobW family GTP-binding protein n=1 Tax=Natronobeatus ordinarius TaxID=2963433 RepID=UPI0020CDF29F|nr:GTP-binding protein [Natronobeatus ordinarius]